MKSILKVGLPIGLGVFLIWNSYVKTSPADRELILFHIRQVDLLWISISLIIGLISHLARAFRWNYLLAPMGYNPRFENNIMIIMMAYLANMGIPRSGEFLRATALATYEKVPFQKGFGTIVTERMIDLIMLLLVILIALFSQTDIILNFLSENGLGLTGSGVVLLIGIGGLFGLRWFLNRSKSPASDKLRTFIRGLLEGVLSIFSMPNKWPFLAYTLLIWACYFAMFWVIKFTVPDAQNLSFGALLVGFVAGAFAMAATPGGLGLYPIAVGQALMLFGLPDTSGDAFGWIMWIAQTLMVFFLGALSFLILPLWNRKR
ncbi:MAG: hypothetical protein RLZZ241_1544 [Bacteroidota bacterium]